MIIGRREFLAGAIGAVAATRLRAVGCDASATGRPGRVLVSGVYADFGSNEKWTQIAPEIAVDSSRFANGLRTLRLTSRNGAASAAECVLGAAPQSRLIQFDVFVEDPATCARMEFLLSSNGTGWIAKVTNNPTLVAGWNRLQFSVNDCVLQGKGMTLDEWDKVTKARLYFVAKPGVTASMWVGPIQWLRTRPAVTFTFDDGRRGCYENAMPIMATYGWGATLYLVTDSVGKRSYRLGGGADTIDPMNLYELHSMQDAGWDISSHTVTHPDLTQLPTAQKQYEMTAAKEWLLKNDFKSGARFFATPFGKRDPETQAIAQNLYENLRDASAAPNRGYETPLNMNLGLNTRYALRFQELQSLSRTPLKTFQSWVEAAIASGTWLIIVGHAVDNPDGWLDPDVFRRYLNYLDDKRDEIDVVTMSQYWDARNCERAELSKNFGPAAR